MTNPRVFISSTSEDLSVYRKAAEEGARIAACLPDTHELWVARDNPPLAECLKRVREADVLVVIVAYRYGWVPPDQAAGERKSITWLECDEAVRRGKNVLAFLVDDAVSARWPAEAREEYRLAAAAIAGNAVEIAAEVQHNVAGLQAFKKWLQGRGIRDTFTSPEDLRGKVALSLNEWKQAHPEFGAGSVPSAAIPRDPVPYLESLRAETGYIEIRGLRTAEGSVHRFPIADLYIPLADDLGSGRRSLPGMESAGELGTERKHDLDESLQHDRLVVVGDPGSGKTTFLNRIVWRLCESRLAVREQDPPREFAFAPATFPVLIRVFELAEFFKSSTASNDPRDWAMWLVRFLAAKCGPVWGLDEEFFLKQFKEGPCLLALDGLDEAADSDTRERVSGVVRSAARVWPNCRILITTRPKAYTEDVVLGGFHTARIADLDPERVRTFLSRWSQALFPENPERAERHASELSGAVESRPEIQRIAQNPVMLTALAVLHWNEKRLPQQRSELYEEILRWLSRSRKMRLGRPDAERCINLLQELARAMHEHPSGRQVQVSREWAARTLAPRFREFATQEAQLSRAAAFLEEEELDSGIIVRRASDVRFWHLTFQEHLAARALVGEDDGERRRVLFTEQRAWQPEWREVVLLLSGLLHQQKPERVDALLSAALDTLTGDGLAARLRNWIRGGVSLADQSRCVSLLGAILFDLEPFQYQPKDPRFEATLRAATAIFDPERWRSVPLEWRLGVAEAVGRAGDHRLRQDNWVRLPAGTFSMGEGDEAHQVSLSAFEIGKYPVTVEEFGRYVAAGGTKPYGWEGQAAYPTRPVVSVSWQDAAAYCQWAGLRLPTEAQWERAARGLEGRPYPWGPEEPDPSRANYRETKIGAPTPVGLFPAGATPEGICDLAGNVWEWVADWYSDYSKESEQDPLGPVTGKYRVMRGGSWIVSSGNLRASYRSRYVPVNRVVSIGFRCAREVSFP